jgi:hypothetical protein
MFTTLLCLASSLSAPPPKAADQPIYFPTEVGVKWETHLTGQLDDKDITYLFSVEAVQEKDGETTVTVKQRDTQTFLYSTRYKLTKDGVYNMGSSRGNQSRSYEPPLPELKYPVKKNATWEWKGKYRNEERSETRTITAIEEVKVPAGVYKAAKVEIVGLRASSGDERWKSTEWFAEGVGRVKLVANNLTEEMTKFTAAKK